MTGRQLCVADCTARGQHAPDCADTDQCGGCLPRLAADGVIVCTWHLDKLAADPLQLAELYDEIGLRLAGSNSSGEKTSGTRNPGLSLDARAVGIRTEIRNVLVSWSLMIADERGFTLPQVSYVEEMPAGFIGPPRLLKRTDESTHALASFVAHSAVWLAAHGAAADACNELRDLSRRSYSIAYPSGARVFDVAPCPMHDCAGTIKAIVRRTDALLPSELACDTDDSHQWDASRWLTLGRELRRREAA